jgi:hypothetical protein
MPDSNVRWLVNQHTPLPKISNNSITAFVRYLVPLLSNCNAYFTPFRTQRQINSLSVSIFKTIDSVRQNGSFVGREMARN